VKKSDETIIDIATSRYSLRVERFKFQRS